MKLALKPEDLARLVFLIRGEKVMLAQQLAELYGVPVRALNQAVKRNIKRFPADFMFQLTKEEFERLKSQIVISSWGGLRRARPYACTEQGVAMLSSVLRSQRAVQLNIAIMRTFVQLRGLMDSNRDLARRIEALEKKYDEQFVEVLPLSKNLFLRQNRHGAESVFTNPEWDSLLSTDHFLLSTDHRSLPATSKPGDCGTNAGPRHSLRRRKTQCFSVRLSVTRP